MRFSSHFYTQNNNDVTHKERLKRFSKHTHIETATRAFRKLYQFRAENFVVYSTCFILKKIVINTSDNLFLVTSVIDVNVHRTIKALTQKKSVDNLCEYIYYLDNNAQTHVEKVTRNLLLDFTYSLYHTYIDIGLSICLCISKGGLTFFS